MPQRKQHSLPFRKHKVVRKPAESIGICFLSHVNQMPRAKTEPLADEQVFSAIRMPNASFLWYFKTKRGDYDQDDDINSTIDIAQKWLQMSAGEKVDYEERAAHAKKIWSQTFL